MQTRQAPVSPATTRASSQQVMAPFAWQRQAQATLDAFGADGGVAAAEALLGMLRAPGDQTLSVLARWIAGREVLSFMADGELCLPLFQFDLRSGSIRPGARAVFELLLPVFDAAELVDWFLEPNSWLAYETPLHTFMTDPHAVMEAARADRFVALG